MRLIIDLLMIILLPFLMAYSLIGEKNHETIGSVMGFLFVMHHILNYRWYQTLTKGKYTSVRIFSIIVNLLLTVDMILLIVSGILMSRYVFTFLPRNQMASLARLMHMFGAYFGFVLMSMHIGLHAKSMIIKIEQKYFGIASIGIILSIIISIYGAYAFFERRWLSYILLMNQFVFIDYSESIIFFIIDCFAMMYLFAFLSYLLIEVIKDQ